MPGEDHDPDVTSLGARIQKLRPDLYDTLFRAGVFPAGDTYSTQTRTPRPPQVGMKKGGKVSCGMKKGGKVCRGMGAATRGGKYK